jgi:hypothetical protein
MKVKKQSIRRAVAGILAFIIGISIAIVTIVPLLIYLNTSSGEAMRAFNSLSEYQKQRSSESIDIALIGGTPYIKNTGSTPLTIVLAVIDSGNGCGDRTSMLKTNITMKPGDAILSINATSSSYGPAVTCYVMTARGNVFPVKDRYIALMSQQPQQAGNILFTPNNTIFADDASKYSVDGSYSAGSLSCNTKGYVWNNVTFQSYDPNKKLISVVDNNGKPITITANSGNGCISVAFNNAVSVPQGAYAVVIYYRIIVISSQAKIDVGIIPSLMKNNMIYTSSNSNTIFSPSSIFSGSYLSFEGYSLIPLKGATPGLYDLNITVVFPSLQGSSNPQVGIEYIAIQGATLVTK